METNSAAAWNRRQRRAVIALSMFIGFGSIALAARLAHINTGMYPRLSALRQSQYSGTSLVPARRGMIVDSCGRVLAGSRDLYGVFVDPSLMENLELSAQKLGAILQEDPGQLEHLIRSTTSRRFCWLKHRIEKVDAQAISQADIPGVGLQQESVRHYPTEQSMAQVLGIVSADGRGLEGLETKYDAWLRGQDGRVWTVHDTRRRPIRFSDNRQSPNKSARDGGHIVLTLDSAIQGFAEDALARQVTKFEAKSGVSIAMDPMTGDVLAMASFPSFDPNSYAEHSVDFRRNRALTDMVEPGSTFKSFIGSTAIAEGVVQPGEMIDCHNGLHVIGRRKLHDSHPYGMLSFEDVIAKSSNIAMASLGQKLGNDRLYQAVRRFGFGQPTGIGFPGEASGGVRDFATWTSYSTCSIPMGQEIAVTPIQLIAAFCAIANDGILLKPRLVRAKLSPEGIPVEEFSGPDPVRRVLPSSVADYFVRTVLTGVVNGTTSARNARVAGYQVFGKTGTAELSYKDRAGYEPGAYMSAFVGAAPADDPRIAVLVMIQYPNPKIGYYGGVVSGPAVSEILSAALPYLGVEPEDPAIDQ